MVLIVLVVECSVFSPIVKNVEDRLIDGIFFSESSPLFYFFHFSSLLEIAFKVKLV